MSGRHLAMIVLVICALVSRRIRHRRTTTMMRFVETLIFTGAIENLLDHERYRALQETSILRPCEGAVIPKSGGLRKIRWAPAGMGKRRGCRIIDYWDEPTETFTMHYAYRKSEQEGLSAVQLRTLS